MTIENALRLADLRRAHGFSQEELAEKLNVSRQAISKWERAESSPDTDNLIALAQLYGVSLDDLLGLRLARQTEVADTEELPADGTDAPSDCTAARDPLPNGSYYEHIARQAAEAAEAAAKEAARERRRLHLAFPYPVVVAIAYLVLGSIFGMWHPGWMIFLTIPLYYLPESELKPVRLLGNPVMITIIYLFLGFFLDAWHPGWLVFLLVPILNSLRL